MFQLQDDLVKRVVPILRCNIIKFHMAEQHRTTTAEQTEVTTNFHFHRRKMLHMVLQFRKQSQVTFLNMQ